MTPAGAYVAALVLGSAVEAAAERDSWIETAVELALTNDFSFEDRLALRDAAAMVLRTRHPEVDLQYAIKTALDCYLGTRW